MSYFKDERTTLHLMHPALTAIIACINTSFEQPGFCIAMKSGQRGFSISLNGKVVCKGKNLTEFATNWKHQQEAAIAKAAAKTTPSKS